MHSSVARLISPSHQACRRRWLESSATFSRCAQTAGVSMGLGPGGFLSQRGRLLEQALEIAELRLRLLLLQIEELAPHLLGHPTNVIGRLRLADAERLLDDLD